MLDDERKAYVYILECSDGTLYTGWTWDWRRRIDQHNGGKGSKYVRARLPVRLRHLETVSGKRTAMKREAEIKKMTRLQKWNLIQFNANIQ